MKVSFAPSARQDFIDIFDYIATDNLAVAEAFADDLESACRKLAEFPRRFPVIGQIGGRDVHRRPYLDYVILYFVSGTDVRVTRILDGGRDVDSLLDP